jgi:excisionase family DNA binding protein
MAKAMEPLLTPAELSKLLKCSLPYIYKIAASGILPCVRIANPGSVEKRKKDMVRFKKDDVFAWIEKHYQNPNRSSR